jgi:tetratricopeptide (TPR) repeat protein
MQDSVDTSDRNDEDAVARRLAEMLLKVANDEVSLSRVLDLHPRVLRQLTDKAIGLVEHGKVEEGEALLEDLSAIDVESAVLPFLLGACRARQKRSEAALEAYDRAIARAGRANNDAIGSTVRLCRAQALLELGRLDEARDDLDVVAKGPDPALGQQAKVALERLLENTRETER